MDARITIPIQTKKKSCHKNQEKTGWEADEVPLTAPIKMQKPIGTLRIMTGLFQSN